MLLQKGWKMKKLLLLGLALALAFSTGGATANQIPGNWTCETLFSVDPILEIEGFMIRLPPDVEIRAEAYGLFGFTRVWVIDEDKNIELHIEPDGSGAYYIFGDKERAKPELTFSCSPPN